MLPKEAVVPFTILYFLHVCKLFHKKDFCFALSRLVLCSLQDSSRAAEATEEVGVVFSIFNFSHGNHNMSDGLVPTRCFCGLMPHAPRVFRSKHNCSFC